jgi:outer membrane lipoprotein-sorting protein
MAFSIHRAGRLALLLTVLAGTSVRADEGNVGPEWTAFEKIADHFNDVTFEVATHIVNATGEHDNVLRISFRKPHYARCEVIDGNGAGGVAVWRGGPMVLVRPPGLLSRFSLALKREDPHVVDSRGRGCGQTTLDNFAKEYAADGSLEESAGPAIDGAPTDTILWKRTGDDPSGDTKRLLYISKTTHLPVELKSYRGSELVEDSHYRNIMLDTNIPFSTFDL